MCFVCNGTRPEWIPSYQIVGGTRVTGMETDRIAGVVGRIGPFDRPIGSVVRYTMTRGLRQLKPDRPLPFGYRLEPYCEPMAPAYASVLAVAFADSSDLDLYPKLASREGCTELVREMTELPGFLPGASWLVLFNREPCGLTLTNRVGRATLASVQVVAVAPRHRRISVGSHLVTKALWAFRDRRLESGEARINRTNRAAVLFFRSLGFQVSGSKTFSESPVQK